MKPARKLALQQYALVDIKTGRVAYPDTAPYDALSRVDAELDVLMHHCTGPRDALRALGLEIVELTPELEAQYLRDAEKDQWEP